MKTLWVLLFGFIVWGTTVHPLHAEMRSSAVASVFVNVVPNVSVAAKTSVVNAGIIQTGQKSDFSATIVFSIAANSMKVKMYLEASDLYIGDNPTSTAVAPIPVDTAKSAGISMQSGQTGGKPRNAAWAGAGADILSYKTKSTEIVEFETSRQGSFNEDVACTIFYTQPDPSKPVGQYGGKVRLVTMITP